MNRHGSESINELTIKADNWKNNKLKNKLIIHLLIFDIELIEFIGSIS